MVDLFEGYRVGNQWCLRCEWGSPESDKYRVVVGEMVEENGGGLVQLGGLCRSGGWRRSGWEVLVIYL